MILHWCERVVGSHPRWCAQRFLSQSNTKRALGMSMMAKKIQSNICGIVEILPVWLGLQFTDSKRGSCGPVITSGRPAGR